MFRETNSQISLLECQFLLPESKRRRLESSWAHPFQRKILPLIDEKLFKSCFSEKSGRPNKSIRLLVGLHLLKEWNDLTDSQVLDEFEFNLQWHYALGVEPSRAHVCQKTLHNFRVRLMSDQQAQRCFESLTSGLVELDGLDVGQQRLDSTHVISNIAVLTRLGLFTETTTKFLRELRKRAPERLAQLAEGYVGRYLDREGYFADATKEQARRRLPMVAVDIYRLVQAFSEDEVVSKWESYGLLKRLLEEQCEVVEEPQRDGLPGTVVEDKSGTGEFEGGSGQDGVEAAPEEDAGTANAQESPSAEAGAGVDSEPPRSPAADESDGGQQVPPTGDSNSGSKATNVAATAKDEAGDEDDDDGGNAGMPVKLREPKTISSASLQSPHDADATYGRKGKGYEVQVAETCVEDNPYQVVTGVSVNGAHESDQHALIPMVDQLDSCKLKPHEMLADTGYGSGQNIVECAVRGVDLQAPVQDPGARERRDSWVGPVEPNASGLPDPPVGEAVEADCSRSSELPLLGLEDFQFNDTYSKVLECPAGHEPVEQRLDEPGKMLWAQFSADKCPSCPLAGLCPTRETKSGARTLRTGTATAATAKRQAEQQQPAFKEHYKKRSGVESTNAELKRRHGADNLRVRGRLRVELSLLLKAMALNAKRAVLFHVDELRENSEFQSYALA